MQEEKKFSLVGALKPKSNRIVHCLTVLQFRDKFKTWFSIWMLYYCLVRKCLLLKYSKDTMNKMQWDDWKQWKKHSSFALQYIFLLENTIHYRAHLYFKVKDWTETRKFNFMGSCEVKKNKCKLDLSVTAMFLQWCKHTGVEEFSQSRTADLSLTRL